MASTVLEFLRYGAPASPIQALDSSITSPFLPSLALAATESSALLTPLLSSLVSHSQTPRAFAYALLDYGEICRYVLEAEKSGEVPGISRVEEDDDEEIGDLKEDEESGELDECDAFQQGDETERVKLAIISLRHRAAEFEFKWAQRWNSDECGIEQRVNDEGSLWSNEACIPELMCLVPIAASRCPSLLSSEQLVKGLLTARYGGPLLVTTLVNNPALVDRGVRALTQVFITQEDVPEARPNSPSPQESAPPAARNIAKTAPGLHQQQCGSQPSQAALPITLAEYAEAAVWAIVRLCQVAPSLASICREALVDTCTLGEMTLHITVEVIHDELEFLSRLIFSREVTSQWILSHLGASQKAGDSRPLPPLGKTDGGLTDLSRMKEKEGVGARIRDALLADARSTWQEVGWGGHLHAHLRLYCVLVRVGDLLPTHEEVEFWLKAMSSSTNSKRQPDFVSERTLQLGMAFVCLVPGLSGLSTKGLFHASIGRLLKAATVQSSATFTPFNIELAVWVTVQLLLRRFSDIAVLVREAVGMHVTVQNSLIRDVAEAAVAAGVMSDPSLVANVVASLRPCSPITTNKKQQDLAVKCMELLMQTSSFNFSRYGVDASHALMHCLHMAREPIHPALPQLVQAYAEMSVTVPRGRGPAQPFRMRPFSRDWLVSAIAPACVDLCHNSSSANPKSSKYATKPAWVVATEKRGNSKQHAPNLQRAIASEDPIATAALVVFYILCREQISRNIGVDAGSNSGDLSSGEAGERGWSELLACLPLRRLLAYMEGHWPAYEHLLPQWLSVASIVLPERLLVPALLQDSKTSSDVFKPLVDGVPATADLAWIGPITAPPPRNMQLAEKSELNYSFKESDSVEVSALLEMEIDTLQEAQSVVFSKETVVNTMRNALKEPLPTLRVLQAMGGGAMRWDKVSLRERGEIQLGLGAKVWEVEAAVVKELVPLLLDPACSRCLQESFCVWWRRLPTSSTEYLSPLLLNSLKDPPISSNGTGGNVGRQASFHSEKKKGSQLITLSASGLLQEPLGLLACSARVYRTPLLGVVLDLLMELLTANRRMCQAVATEGGRDGGIKREEVAAALAAQDSAVCQILLEGCLPMAGMGDDSEPGPLLEARSLICATVSSLLHSSPLLLKLLHFQGYDLALIPMMVEGVPTMVQCLDFVGELLQQPREHCQVFAVVLTVHIACAHTSLPQSLSAVQQVVAHVSQVRSKVAGTAGFLQLVLAPLAQCAAAFPVLAPQVVAILQSCAQAGGPLTRSGPERDPALHGAAVAAFKQLIHRKLLYGRPPSLPSTSFS